MEDTSPFAFYRDMNAAERRTFRACASGRAFCRKRNPGKQSGFKKRRFPYPTEPCAGARMATAA
jgi:hypothetical protein